MWPLPSLPASVYQPNRIGALLVCVLVYEGADHAIQNVCVEMIVKITVLEITLCVPVELKVYLKSRLMCT